MPYPDLTEALQARILADLKAEKVGPAPPNQLDPAEIPSGWGLGGPHRYAGGSRGESRNSGRAVAFKRPRRRSSGSRSWRPRSLRWRKPWGEAEALGEQRRQEVATQVKRTEALETQIVTLKEAVAKARTLGAQRRQQAETAVKRADDLVAELVEITSELIEMSKRMAEQTTAMDKLRAEFDEYRSRSRG